MPAKSSKWAERIKDVEREFRVAQLAARLLHARLVADPSALRPARLRRRDADRFEAQLEPTYLVRLYAEFEAGLREAWRRSFGRATFPKMEILIDRVAALRDIPPDLVRAVHQGRAFRNDIVHDVRDGVTPIPIDKARGCLCSYISRLPLDW